MLHATLIIYRVMIIHPPLRDRTVPVDHPAAPTGDELRRQLIDELTSYAPARQMHAMRHWPTGKLSLVHLNVLIVLNSDGPLPMRGLAEVLDVSQASATGIVDRMEQRGLVARERDEAADRRVVRVVLTETGRSLVEGVADQRRDHLARLIDTLTDDDAAALLQGLRAMRRAREALHPEPTPTDTPVPEASR